MIGPHSIWQHKVLFLSSYSMISSYKLRFANLPQTGYCITQHNSIAVNWATQKIYPSASDLGVMG